MAALFFLSMQVFYLNGASSNAILEHLLYVQNMMAIICHLKLF